LSRRNGGTQNFKVFAIAVMRKGSYE